MKNLIVATFVALICVLIASCEYQPRVEEIAGSKGFATFTQKVGDHELLGIQNAAGVQIAEAQYEGVTFKDGYFIGIYPDYGGYDLLDTNGKSVAPTPGRLRFCSYAMENADSLNHFVVGDEKDFYWIFPKFGGRVLEPQKSMYLYPLEQLIVYETDGKFGVLTYENKDLIAPANRLVFANRKTGKLNLPIVYAFYSDGDKKEWKKISRVDGNDLGKLDNDDLGLIKNSIRTKLGRVYAVR